MKRVLLFFLSCIFAGSVFAQTVQIDSISGSQYRIPVSTNGTYSYSQQIIVKNKIIDNGWSENAGNITRIRYHFNNLESLTNSNNWKIYLGETDKNFFATAADWEMVENLTLVYDGFIAEALSTGWYDIFLQTPFPYDGERNLIIAIDENSPGYTPSHTHYSSYIDTVNSGLFLSSQTNPDPLSPPVGTLTMSVPVLQLYFEELCSSPAAFTLSTLNATSADFAWIPQGTEASWNLRYKPINGSNWTTISEINTAAYSLTNLFSIESYIVQIQSACIDTVSEWINPIYFITPEIPGFEHTVNWEIFKNRTEGDFSIMRDTIPDLVIKLDSVVTPDYSTSMDRFFSRIRGYIIPRLSGEFSFHFGCNEIGEFWLSADETEANLVLAISNDTIQTDLTLNHYPQNLIEGNKYYFEILHYDSVYTDLIKLGWSFPGDTFIRTLKTPFISSCGTSVPAQNLSFLNSDITGYPGSEHSIICRFTPWNVSNKSINWLSTDENVATVDESGRVTLVSEGSCQIIGIMADNDNAADTLNVNVWNNAGPFFVKPGASKESNGQNWENAIDLQTLLKILNTRIDDQIITVYASGGLYKPTETIDRNITFSMRNIRFVGGYASTSSGIDTTTRNIENHETILSGEIGIPNETIDNSYHVVTATKSVIIDGITISDGRASSYSYGQVQGYYNIHNDNRGGGLFVPGIKSDVRIYNCKIRDNSAWDCGGGIYCHSASNTINNSSSVTIQNSEFYGNVMEQEVISTGGIFVIIVNCSGGAIAAKCSRLNISGCKFSNNTARGYGNAIYIHLGAEAIIENCSFYDNPGNSEDLYVKDGGIIKMNNSTIDGSLSALSANLELSNSSITDGGYFYAFHTDQFVKLDNIIWPGGWIVHEDEEIGEINVKYSIFKNHLYGNNYQTVMADSVLPYTSWLDSLAYNGGPTPTMKLKNIPGNFALNYGNPLYLDSTDQRGAIRTGYVSIGAYQWVDATEIVISPHQLTLAQGDSIDFEVYFLPAFSSNGNYTVSSSDPNVAQVDSTRLYGISTGSVNIIAQSLDGTLRDTLICQVITNAGIEVLNPNSPFSVYPNPVTNELTLKAMGISGNIRYEILNMFGQVVIKGFFTEQAIINTAGLRSGAYLIQCTSEKTVELFKIIKE